MRTSTERRAAGLLHHLASGGAAFVFILPLAWMVSASLRQPGLPPPRTIEWLPRPLAWNNYRLIVEMLPFDRYALNSLIVAALAVPLTLVTASWAGLALAQLGARARRRLIVLSLGLLMVPFTALWLTRFVLFARLGLVDTYAALIAPALMGSSPLFVLLFYWAFRRVSGEVYESARLDGASALATWAYVALPLARPTVVAVGVLAFLFYWSDFVSPLLYLKSESLYTLPVGLQQLQQLDRTHWPLLMAASVVMTAPAVLLFLLVQPFFLCGGWRAGDD
jgi:multiple sugar transport system permease protein